MEESCLILTTVPDEQTAKKLARNLVENRLAACVTATSPCDSFYRWEGKLTEDRELVLLIKTRTSLFSSVETMVNELHPYSIPELIALPIIRGSTPYLEWLIKETES